MNEQCCDNCEYFNHKYCECEHPDQRQDDIIKNPTDGLYCWLWTSDSE